jgi:cytochrome c biogenesis protein CcmG, thiol:disulfide interchange protein DsbE
MRVVRIVIRLVGVAALLALLIYTLLGGGQPLPKGTPAPPLTATRISDGATAQLKMGNGKPMVINFWATWCTPCLQEMPELVKASEKYKGRVHFIGAAAESNRAQIGKFVERLGITFDVAAVSDDVTRDWNVTVFPSTYIVDANGVIQWSTRGPVDEALLSMRLDEVLQ